jgi:hypothetical protein
MWRNNRKRTSQGGKVTDAIIILRTTDYRPGRVLIPVCYAVTSNGGCFVCKEKSGSGNVNLFICRTVEIDCRAGVFYHRAPVLGKSEILAQNFDESL